jgi:hypothetical protein
MVEKTKRKHVKTGRPRGRPKGTGRGRPRGSSNKVASETRKRIVSEAEANGTELPLDYMLRVMRDPEAEDHRRDSMATSCAKYLHSPAPAITQLQGDPLKPLVSEIKHSFEVPPNWDEETANEEDDTKPPLA